MVGPPPAEGRSVAKRVAITASVLVILLAPFHSLTDFVTGIPEATVLELRPVEGARGREPVIPVSEANLSAEAPHLHWLFERAWEEGGVRTTSHVTRYQLVLYIESRTGSQDMNVLFHYKGRLLEPRAYG